MATTQELLDLKYGRQLLEDRARLAELFSEEILGSAYSQNRHTSDDILNMETLNVYYTLATLKGINLLKNLKNLYAQGNLNTVLNLSNLINLENINVKFSPNLTTIGSLRKLTKLKYININDTSITFLRIDYTSLLTVDCHNAKFHRNAVDTTLLEAEAAKHYDGCLLTTLHLDGENMGIPTGIDQNEHYLSLVQLGVDVTIRTS